MRSEFFRMPAAAAHWPLAAGAACRLRPQLLLLAALAVIAGTDASAADFGIYGEAGTLGLGGGVAVQLNEHLSARLGYSTFSYDVDDYEAEDLTLDAEATLGAGKALVDWYPFGRAFRLTAGLMMNGTEVTAIARPAFGGYTVNGNFYSSSQLASADGRVEFDSVAPYVGIGFGHALDSKGRFNVLVDLGAAIIGEPEITLNANCSPTAAALCAQIQNDIAIERAQIEDDADALKIWPHINVSFSWRF